jgi:hypothetical protein
VEFQRADHSHAKAFASSIVRRCRTSDDCRVTSKRVSTANAGRGSRARLSIRFAPALHTR